MSTPAKTGLRAVGDGENPQDPRPRILMDLELHQQIDTSLNALAMAGDANLYQRDGKVVRIVKRPSVESKPSSHIIQEMVVPALMDMLSRHARFLNLDADGKPKRGRPPKPPKDVCSAILNRDSLPFNVLVGLSDIPVLRPDGTVWDRPGYDQETGMYFSPGGVEFPPIPENPTDRDIGSAVSLLCDVLQDFPWKDHTHLSAAVALILTAIARPAIHGPTPLFSIGSPTPGTGKTLFANVVSIILRGREATLLAPVDSGDEIEKRITSLGLAGARLVVIDNAEGVFGYPALAKAITDHCHGGRELGKSRMVDLPNQFVWVVTGNNLSYKADLGRRVLPLDMDRGTEHPEDYDNYAHADLLGYVKERRPELVSAALTLLRSFFAQGCPAHGGKRYGGFESWDRLIRGAILATGGLADPLDTRANIREQGDADLEVLRATLHELQRVYPSTPFKAADAVKAAESDSDLGAALLALCGGNDYRLNPAKVGTALSGQKERIVDGLKLVSPGVQKGTRRWQVVEVNK